MKKHRLTLGEGKTPLLSSYTAKMYLTGKIELYYKLETMSPVGGFIDRGMALFMENSVKSYVEGFTICSDIETTISAMAYGARCGRPVTIFLNEETMSEEYIEKVSKYDGKIVVVEDSREKIERELEKIKEIYPYKDAGLFTEDGFKEGFAEFAAEIKKESSCSKVFIGIYTDEIKKISALKKAMKEHEVEIIPVVLKNSEEECKSSFDNLVSIERYEAGECMNILRQEGISIGMRDGAALAAVRAYDKSENAKKDEKIVIIITGCRELKETSKRGVTKVNSAEIKDVIGLI
jgi:threonine synthase